MKINLEDLEKVRKLFRSQAMSQVFRWSKCVHGRILSICFLNVVLVFCSLGVTLVTKELVDAAVSARQDLLWKNGLMLLGLVLALATVGMSSAVEAIAARHMGMRVCDINCVTNMAAGVAPDRKLSDEEVVETASLIAERFGNYMERVIASL